MDLSGKKASSKVHSFLKQCLHDLCLTQKWYYHQTFQLMFAVVRLKGLLKVPNFFVTNKDSANTVLKMNGL